ncbi:MAG: amidase [Dehalococcoidia bacterium]|nr:amidase [Dehalococcoidia bacterium]
MHSDELIEASAATLGRLVAARHVSPVELTRLFLDRIGALDPQLHAFITVDAQGALASAREAEAATARGALRGPLHGVPMSIKDLFATKGLRTTSGSRLYKDRVPKEDAVAVERLRQAGVVILGKSSTPEFGLSAITENALVGAARNPWDTRCTTGGSSGGGAAAVAARLTPMDMGDDGGGSIRMPSSYCGVFGMKPSQGRVPRLRRSEGQRPWSNLSQPGPITRSVEDAALLLNAIAGPHAGDVTAMRTPPPDFAAHLRAGVRGLRIAWSEDLGYYPVDPEVRAVAEAAAKAFEGLGAVVEPSTIALHEPFQPFWDIFAAGAYAAQGELLEQHREELGGLTIISLEAGMLVTGAEFSQALAAQEYMAAQFADLFTQFDLLLMPTTPTTAFPLGQRPRVIAGQPVDPLWSSAPFTFPFNVTGHPAASLPCGFTSAGLPVGLQVVGRPADEVTVLRACMAFEEARPWVGRKPAVV